MEQCSLAFVAAHELTTALESRSKPIVCKRNSVLFRQGQAPVGVYLIRYGEAVLVMESASGGVVMCLRAGPGSVIGLPGVIANEPYSLTALARRGSDVRFTTCEDFTALMTADPSLYPRVLEVLAAEIRAARQALLGLRSPSPEQ